jgi:GABA(A) receptor-associated protein
MIPFRERYTLDERRREYESALNKRSGYIPTILERGSLEVPLLDKEKYMIPEDLNGAQLIYIIRRRMHMKSSQALFLLCNKQMVTTSDSIRQIYSRHRNSDDGFLYITYTLENAFG